MRKSLLILLVFWASPALAQSVTGFEEWLATFRADAARQGISSATLDAAFTGKQPVMRVIELDRRQPEFVQGYTDYLSRRVTPRQVARGRALLAEHAALLEAVTARTGVPANVLVAFWGLETNYGTTLGSFNIPIALATLAWEGRRSAFFRSQLIEALRIVEAGHVSASDMNGSWAGAMGHMQFMPSTFRGYAVDGDGDGRIDLWGSLPDAMHSAGNYLRAMRWRSGEPIAQRVNLPQDFDLRWARLTHRKTLAEWSALGVAPTDEVAWPAGKLTAAVVLPQGWQGPAYLVFDNFDGVMRWNRSVNYALSVAELARQIAGGGPAPFAVDPAGGLSIAAIETMQHQLNALGYDTGVPDGLVGPRTQAALRRFQAEHALPADGYPSAAVTERVAARYAEYVGNVQSVTP